MPLHSADALILRSYKLGEADRIVVFLTDDRGKRRGVAKGARRPKSRFSGGLEPLTRVRVAYFERERLDLVRLRYIEPVCSPLARSNGEALAYVGYFAELTNGRQKLTQPTRCFALEPQLWNRLSLVCRSVVWRDILSIGCFDCKVCILRQRRVPNADLRS